MDRADDLIPAFESASSEAQRAFADAILNPEPPSKALRRAADAYRNLIQAPE